MPVQYSPKPIIIQNEDESIASFPMTDGENGKTPIFQPSIIPPGYYFYGTGAFDDITNNKIGEGVQLALKTDGTAADEVEVDGRFLTHVYVVGGDLAVFAGEYDDYCSLTMVSPASAPVANGGGTGNANKVSVGPFNIIVPAAGDGAWDVDGSDMEQGEINQSLSPVPAFDANSAPNGWWNWDPTATPSITPNFGNTGAYNLFDAELKLGRQANRYPLTSGNVTPAASIKAKKILPHWIWRFTLKRGAVAGTAKIAIRLDLARLTTV